MSKLSFRARALDATKPMPIYMAEELPDLPDFSAINRAVPQMPSGMQKEEECEHHLQRAICAGLIIPTPEVTDMPVREFHDKVYPANYKQPRQLIHMQPLSMEADVPDYDMDSEDERWLAAQTASRRLDLPPLKFEEMMDRLEKSSGQTVVTLAEAKALLREDDELIVAVFDYWLNKRLKTQHPLIPSVKTEQRAGAAANNPYLAFRRRTEKMQTRKNRKNDEVSYEKMLKLKRDLCRAVTLLELVKRREKIKREYVHLTVEVFEKRYQAGDWSGAVVAEAAASKPRPAFTPIFHNHYPNQNNMWPTQQTNKTQPALKDEMVPRREKRQYKKRKHKGGSGHGGRGGGVSSDEETTPAHLGSASEQAAEEQADDEGPFAFRRNRLCSYHMPLSTVGNWPWCSKEEHGLADRRFRFALTSLSNPRRCIGFARRRVGRGGRVIIDRVATDYDDLWRGLDFSVMEPERTSTSNDQLSKPRDAEKSLAEPLKRLSSCDDGEQLSVKNDGGALVKNDSDILVKSDSVLRTSDFIGGHYDDAVKVECKQEPPDEGVADLVRGEAGPMLLAGGVDDDEVEFLRALRRDWPHFRPRTPPEDWSPPCDLLPEEEPCAPQGAFSMEIRPLDNPPGTLLDSSTFLSEPFDWGHEPPDWTTGHDTLISSSSSSSSDTMDDSVGCSRFALRNVGGKVVPTVPEAKESTESRKEEETMGKGCKKEGQSANGLLAQFGLDVTGPIHNTTSNGGRPRHAKISPYTFTGGGGLASHALTLNSHSANAILELPIVSAETDSQSATGSPDPKSASLVRKNNLAMEVT